MHQQRHSHGERTRPLYLYMNIARVLAPGHTIYWTVDNCSGRCNATHILSYPYNTARVRLRVRARVAARDHAGFLNMDII